MQYMYCKKFATTHHTCMLHHVLKVSDALAKCKRVIPPVYHQHYKNLYNNAKEKLGGRKRAADDNAVCVSEMQSNGAYTLQS